MGFRDFAVLHKIGVLNLSHLSETIKRFQKENNIRSVMAIANASGVPVSTLYDVMKERTVNLSVDNSQKLADYMGISVDELYGKEKTLDAEAPRAKQHIKFNELLDTLSEEEQQKVYEYLQFVADKHKRR